MRPIPFLALVALIGPARAEPAPRAARPAERPVVACPALANYRILLRQAGDAAGAAAILADPKADHLGCARLGRDAIVGVVERVTLDGQTYACLSLQSTNICQWTQADAVVLPAQGAKPGAAKR